MEAATLSTLLLVNSKSAAGAGQRRAFVVEACRITSLVELPECDRGRGCGPALVCSEAGLEVCLPQPRRRERYSCGATVCATLSNAADRSRPICGAVVELLAPRVHLNEVWHGVEHAADRSLWNARVFRPSARLGIPALLGCTRRSRPAPRGCAPTAGRPLQRREIARSPTRRLSSAAREIWRSLRSRQRCSIIRHGSPNEGHRAGPRRAVVPSRKSQEPRGHRRGTRQRGAQGMKNWTTSHLAAAPWYRPYAHHRPGGSRPGDPFFSEVAKAFQRAARQGLRLLISSSRDPELEREKSTRSAGV